MPSMDYFRRPVLAGQNLPRLKFAIIRGAKRRSDPDNDSLVPHFKNVSAGDTLVLRVQGTQHTVSLPGGSLQGILDVINAHAAGTDVIAFDADGCLGLQSKTQGFLSDVAVVGGVAAEALGFDLASHLAVWAKGGDIASSAEAGVGNWQGVAFPRKGENFSTDSINRVAGRLSSNLDVLYADALRSSARLQKVNTDGAIVGSGQAHWTPGPEVRHKRIYNGLGLLGHTSFYYELAPYFVVVDRSNGQLAPSKVLGVTRGVPGGSFPFTPSDDWASEGGTSVLGQDLVKTSASAIAEIREGRVVVCPGSTFQTDGVVVGDCVSISGATNLSPFSHNGYRWAVEEVISQTTLALRPLSASELKLLGQSFGDNQPVVELNATKTSTEDYGSLVVSTGAFTSEVTFVFDPPLAPGGSYDVWACQPTSLREGGAESSAQPLAPIFQQLASRLDSAPNGILSGLGASLSGSNVAVAQGYVRWHSGAHFVPARTFVPSDFPTGVSYVYWNENDCLLKVSADPNDWGMLYTPEAPKGHLIARVNKTAGGVIDNVSPLARLIAESAQHITVGPGGQFENLEQAVRHINAYTAGGVLHPRFEVELTGDTAFPFETIQAHSVRIYGSSPEVRLSGGKNGFVFAGAGTLVLEDLTVGTGTGTAARALVDMMTSGSSCHLRSVRGPDTYDWDYAVYYPNGLYAKNVLLEDCTLSLKGGVVIGLNSGSRIHAQRNVFKAASSGVGVAWDLPQLFGWGATHVHALGLYDNRFEGWKTTAGSEAPLLFKLQAVEGLYVERNAFSFGAFPANSTAVLMEATGSSRARVVGNRLESSINAFFRGGENTFLEDNVVQLKMNGRTLPAISCGTAMGNLITSLVPDTATQEGMALGVHRLAAGNVLGRSGDDTLSNFNIGCYALSPYARFVGNTVHLYSGTTESYGIFLNVKECVVEGNFVRVHGPAGALPYGIYSNITGTLVLGNHLRVDRGRGIYMSFEPNAANFGMVSSNYVWHGAVPGSTVSELLFLESASAGARYTVVGNQFIAAAGLTYGIFTGANTITQMEGNLVDVSGGVAVRADGQVQLTTTRVNGGSCHFKRPLEATGNVFYGPSAWGDAGCPSYSIVGNHFFADVNLHTTSDGQASLFNDNRVTGNLVSTASNGAGTLRLSGNDVAGDTDLTAFSTFLSMGNSGVIGDLSVTAILMSLDTVYVGGTSSVAATEAQVSNCLFVGNAEVNGYGGGGLLQVTGSRYQATLTQLTTVANILRLSNCNVAGVFTHTTTDSSSCSFHTHVNAALDGGGAAVGSQSTFHDNYIGGNFTGAPGTDFGNNDVMGNVDIVGAPGSCIFDGNRINGTVFGTGKAFPSGSKLIFNGNSVGGSFGGATGVVGTSTTPLNVEGNHFFGTVKVSPCLFNGNDVAGALSLVRCSDVPGIYPAVLASCCHFRSGVDVAGEASFSQCSFDGALTNSLALTYLFLDSCLVAGDLDLTTETLQSLRMTNSHVHGVAKLGATSASFNAAALAGGIGSLSLSGTHFFQDTYVGALTNMAGVDPGNVAIGGCYFRFTLNIVSESASCRVGLSNSYVHSSLTLKRGACRLEGNHLKEGLQALGVEADAGSLRMLGNTVTDRAELAGLSKSHVEGNTLEPVSGVAALLIRSCRIVKVKDNFLQANLTVAGEATLVVSKHPTAYGSRKSEFITIDDNTVFQEATAAGKNAVYVEETEVFSLQDNILRSKSDWDKVALIKSTAFGGIVGGNIYDSARPDTVNSQALNDGQEARMTAEAGSNVYWRAKHLNAPPAWDITNSGPVIDGGVSRYFTYLE